MIKKLIAPLQKLMMQKNICPACTRPLGKAVLIGKIDEKNVVVCKCKRVFLYNTKIYTYQRALDADLERMIKIKAGNAYIGKRR